MFILMTGYSTAKSEAIKDFKEKLLKVIEINQDYIKNIYDKIISKDIIDAEFVTTNYSGITLQDKDNKRIQITQFDKDNDV